MTRLIDVAAAADVSASAVSHVLNGREGKVSEETCSRILQAVEQLSYTPNHAARVLKGATTNTIGLVVTGWGFGGPFFGHMVDTIEGCAEDRNYSVVLIEMRPEFRNSLGVRAFLKHRPDAVIVLGGGSTLDFRSLAKRGGRIVHIGNMPLSCEAKNVAVDDESGIRDVVEHLCSLGHRNIGFVGDHGPLHRRRSKIFAKVADENGCNVRPEWNVVYETRPAMRAGANRGLMTGRKWIERAGENLPTALVAVSDWVALGTMRALSEQGIRVPADISLTGFDNIPTAEVVIPSLTTVRQPLYEMAHVALSWVLPDMGPVPAEDSVLCKPELIVRESTAAPRANAD